MAAHPVVAALKERSEGAKFSPVLLSGNSGQNSVVVFSFFPLSERRQAIVSRCAGNNPVAFYPLTCVRAKNFGDKLDLPFRDYVVGVLKPVPAKIIVLIGTTDPGIKGKHCVNFSRPPSLQDAEGNQEKLTQLWETWFKGEWDKVLPLIKKYCDSTQNRLEFLQPKRKADGELKGRDTKNSKAEKPKCVE